VMSSLGCGSVSRGHIGQCRLHELVRVTASPYLITGGTCQMLGLRPVRAWLLAHQDESRRAAMSPVCSRLAMRYGCAPSNTAKGFRNYTESNANADPFAL
ncbi:MAG: hypothetical protein AAB403_06670, partial [Planctomycetota bacterium]